MPAVRPSVAVTTGRSRRWRACARSTFAQPRACLRASPLPKTYGWGLHYDSHGRITLHPVGSPEYVRLSQDSSLTQLRAMRSSRARTHTARLSVDALNLGHTEPNAEERHDHPH